MPDNSFDVVSQIEMPEVNNAIQQAMKEITTRYDLKDSKSNIELNEKDKKVTLSSSDDFKLKLPSNRSMPNVLTLAAPNGPRLRRSTINSCKWRPRSVVLWPAPQPTPKSKDPKLV